MVRRAALEAGDITLKYFDFGEAMQTQTKADGSPVTNADREAEEFIHKALSGITPEIPVVGEESVGNGHVPSLATAEYFWLVDAIDGTRQFISGDPQYTVNIALIHKGDPILGVVFAPAKGILYAAHSTDKVIRWNQDTDKEKFIRVRRTPKEGMTVMLSQRQNDETKLNNFLDTIKVEKMLRQGSSLKICSIAEGKADIYPRFGITCEWDIAAGDAILRAAGGFITDMQGNSLRYGGAHTKFHNPEFIACSFEWVQDS